jgi:hypothetical protein
MIMAGMQTGGAIMPNSEPMAMKAVVWTAGRPICNKTGATKAPVVKIAVAHAPVIMPGNMISSISPMSRRDGHW